MKIQETTNIYTLSCPETGIVRYIGKSDNPDHRFQNHMKREHVHSKKSSWIISLKRKNLLPIMDIIDVVPHCDWVFWEMHYIKMFMSCGAKLVNGDMGGKGGHLTQETRKKLSLKNKGKDNLSPEQRVKANQNLIDFHKTNSPWNKGKKYKAWLLTDEQRKNKSIVQVGKHGGKPILQYDLKGNFITEWINVYQCAKQNRFNAADLFRSLKTGRRSGGFLWGRKNGEEIPLKIVETPDNIKRKIVLQFDKNNVFLKEFSCAAQIQEEFGFSFKKISLYCLSGKLYKNYFWKYKL